MIPVQAIDDHERLAWWQLSRTDRVGPITFFKLLERFGSARAALAALPDLSRRGGAPLKPFDRAAAEREASAIFKGQAQMIAACEPSYPALLRQIDDAPPVIIVRGRVDMLNKPCVGIVGARNASLSGRKMALTLARDLGTAGYTIASGLARGIDTAAHEGAINTGTIAVVAGGVDFIYPPENEKLYAQIADQGAILSEHPMGLEPTAPFFPRRNRLISGISQGTLVVEATVKSGSLITARQAADQGRDVFAVPGSPLDPRAGGPNQLIRDGAILVEAAPHIISVLQSGQIRKNMAERENAPYQPAPTPINESEVAQARPLIISILSPTPVLVDEVIRTCQLSSQVVHAALLELELGGRVERLPGNRVALIVEDESFEHERTRYR